MKSLAHTYAWWPGMDRDIENIAKTCMSCQQNKHAQATAPLHPWTWPGKACGDFTSILLVLSWEPHFWS